MPVIKIYCKGIYSHEGTGSLVSRRGFIIGPHPVPDHPDLGPLSEYSRLAKQLRDPQIDFRIQGLALNPKPLAPKP